MNLLEGWDTSHLKGDIVWPFLNKNPFLCTQDGAMDSTNQMKYVPAFYNVRSQIKSLISDFQKVQGF